MRTSAPIAAALVGLHLVGFSPSAAQQRQGGPPPAQQQQQPQQRQRTEEEARQAAARNIAQRDSLRRATDAPVELIPSYVKAAILPVPDSLRVAPFNIDPFYKKYVDAQGIPVLSSERVPDDALLVARDIINSMLAMRPDIRKAMIDRRWRTGVIAEVEMTMDIPEYSRMKRPGAPQGEPVVQADRDYHANRSRGLGGNPTTGAEENLLGYPRTRYYGEHIFVHEFAHAVMTGLRTAEPDLYAQIRVAYDSAMAAGKYVHPDGRRHYATTNQNEYWAEGAQWWFFSNYGECFAGNVKVDTPDEFKAYDPKLYEILGKVFNTHHIPMDVFHGKRVRTVNCPSRPPPTSSYIPEEEGTFSIIGRDTATGELGIAVQSRTIAVGSRVAGGKGGVAVFAHQSGSNPMYSAMGVELIQSGMTPQQALDYMVRADEGRANRQVAILDIDGRSAAYTSPTIAEWKGHKCGVNYCAQGNTLAGPAVVDSMAGSFETSTGPLAERLFAALEAGQRQGGDRRGMQSAALLVLRPRAIQGFGDRALDLRVDESEDPFKELRRILTLVRAGQRR